MRKINLQMYSFSDGKHNDTRENLKTASELGYDGVELFGPNYQVPAEEMKELLGRYGLAAVSMHAPGSDSVERMIPYARTVGMKFIGLGVEPMPDDDAVHRFAEKMNRIGTSCRDAGLVFVYHNHTQEFLPCGETTVIDTLMNETDPGLVSFELDAGWCAAAGYDPVEFVRTYSGRVRLIHVKESSEVVGPQEPLNLHGIKRDENGNVILPPEIREKLASLDRINCAACRGIVDWAKLAEFADRNGCEGYIVEREYSAGDRIEALAADIRAYRGVL